MATALQTRQVYTLIITWLAYASTYLLRKPLGVIKPDLEKTLHLKKSQMGWLDASLLLPYAVMQMLLGGQGDKIGARKALSICLIGSALSMVSPKNTKLYTYQYLTNRHLEVFKIFDSQEQQDYIHVYFTLMI